MPVEDGDLLVIVPSISGGKNRDLVPMTFISLLRKVAASRKRDIPSPFRIWSFFYAAIHMNLTSLPDSAINLYNYI